MLISRIPQDVKDWLDNTHGLIEPNEGRFLAKLAGEVPASQAIVEVGSHTGLSSLWLAAGSRVGNGAHITCIDPWGPPRPNSRDDPWELGPDGVLERFCQNISGTTQEVPRESYWDLVTPLRTTSVQAASMWVKPIGLVFIDAVHEYEAVHEDHAAWQPHVAQGGHIAFHDHDESYPGCYRAIEEIKATGFWARPRTVGSLWVGRRG